MKDRISRIVSETVDRYILREAVDFTSLNTCGDRLEQAANNLAKIDTSKMEKEIGKFYYSLQYFTLQVIFAIRRCVKGMNLNEAVFSSLSDYGIETPREMTIWNDSINSYHKTQNFLNRNFNSYGKSYGNKQNVNGIANTKVNPNQVKSERLSVLLGRINQYAQSKTNLEAKYSTRINDVGIIQLLTQTQQIYSTQPTPSYQ